jgi:hypothetical protein
LRFARRIIWASTPIAKIFREKQKRWKKDSKYLTINLLPTALVYDFRPQNGSWGRVLQAQLTAYLRNLALEK